MYISKVDLPQLNKVEQPDVFEIKRTKMVFDTQGREVEVFDDGQTERLTKDQLLAKKTRLQAQIKEIDDMLVEINNL